MDGLPLTLVRQRSLRQRVLLVLLALGWLAGSLVSQPTRPAPGSSRSLSFELEAPGLEAADLEVHVQGQPRAVLSVERLSSSRLVVFFDLPLATPPGVAAAARELGERAERLVALGPVHLLVGDVVVESLLESTRDARQLESALAEVASERAAEAGKLLELRHALHDLARAHDSRWETEALELIEEEDDLVRWQLQGLFDALVDVPGSDERVLLLVQDGFDLEPLALIEQAGKQPSSRFRRLAPARTLAQQRELARTLAALGFTVVPLSLAGEPAAELLPAARAPQVELAQASGGWAVTSPGELDQLLSSFSHRWRLSFGDAPQASEPVPVDLRLLTPTATAEPRWRRWTIGVPPPALTASRARRLLEGEEKTGGADLAGLADLAVEAVLIPDRAGGPGAGARSTGAPLEAFLEVQVRLPETSPTAAQPRDTSTLRLTLYTTGLDSAPQQLQAVGSGQPIDAGTVRYRARVELPGDLEDAVVVVEDLLEGRWGATLVELRGRGLDAPAALGVVTERTELRQPGAAADAGAASPERSSLLRIVPPAGNDLRGRVTIKTLVSNVAVREVRFYLDGTEVALDGRAPFGAEIDLGDQVAEHEISARAFSQAGVVLGEDSVVLHAPLQRLGLSLSQIALDPATREARVAAQLRLAPESQLDRVEFYRNERLVATLTRPPFEARLPAPPPGPTDYVRVVAWLADGGTLEDVRLLGAGGADEAVQVNLVQVFVVATDKTGQPVEGLIEADFALRRGGQPQAIERFVLADQVPLVLGLVIDTSFSMDPIMNDTQTAAVRFLGETMTAIDRAFVVDFDDSPRLAHPITDQMFALLQSVGRLQAKGFTALYDAIVFSLLQFDQRPGRRALVLLSDGDDVKSRFGYRRTYQSAKRSGVPIYVIALGGLDPERPSFRKDDLEAIAEASAGRVFYVESMAEVAAAYRLIGTELRSQYVLGFTTDRALSDEELQGIEVTLPARRELRVRRSVGQGL